MIATQDVVVYSPEKKFWYDVLTDMLAWILTGYNWLIVIAVIALIYAVVKIKSIIEKK